MSDIFKSIGLGPKSRLAAKNELCEIDRALSCYDRAIDEVLDHPNLSKVVKSFIQDMWYGDSYDLALSWGNRGVRRAATAAAIAVCLKHANDSPKARRGKTRFRMFTTCPELGITSYAEPKLRIASLARHFDQAMRAAGAEGLGFLDIGLFRTSDELKPSQVGLHMHAAVHLPTVLGPRAAERLASPRKRRNSLGGKVVKITAKGSDRGKPLFRREVAHLVYYVTKISGGLKCVLLKQRRTETLFQFWGMVEALRHLELYSHCDAFQVVRGVGVGKQLRREWKELLRQALMLDALPWGPKLDHEKLQKNWARVWRELGEPLSAVTVAN